MLPIASITKLMTAMVMLERGLNLEQRVAISDEDYDLRQGHALAAAARAPCSRATSCCCSR